MCQRFNDLMRNSSTGSKEKLKTHIRMYHEKCWNGFADRPIDQ